MNKKKLYWTPSRRKNLLSEEIKYIIGKNISIDEIKTITLDDSYIDYFQGLADCNLKEAEILIDAINKYEEIDIWLE